MTLSRQGVIGGSRVVKMIPIPTALFHMLCTIPWFGNCFNHKKRRALVGDSMTYVPLLSFIDFFLRGVLVAIVPFAIWLFFFSNIFDEFTPEQIAAENSNEAKLRRIWVLEDDEVEAALDAASVESLVDNWHIFQETSDAGFLVRMNRIHKSLRAAEKIADSNDPEYSRFGLSQKLYLNSELWLLHRKLEQPADDVLQSLANDLIMGQLVDEGQGGEQLASAVQLAELVSLVDEKLTGEVSSEEIAEIDGNFEVEKLDANDELVVDTALGLSELVEAGQSQKLLTRKLLDWFAVSTNSRVQELLEKHPVNLSGRPLDTVDVNDVSSSDLSAIGSELESEFKQLAASATPDKIDQLTRYGLKLLSIGRHEIIEKQRPVLEAVEQSELTDSQALELSKLLQRSSIIGQSYTPSGLTSASGLSVEFKPVTKQLILFASDRQMGESKVSLLQITERIGNAFLNKGTGLSIVFMHTEDAAKELKDMEAFDRSHQYLDVYFVPEASEDGVKAKQFFAIDQFPVEVLLLDGKIHLVAPSLSSLERAIYEKRGN